jgi:hypothetical protein
MPADKPVLVDGPNHLFCIWTGNDDYTDASAAGYVNSEIFGSFSTDNGLTWANYVNLTNTRSYGAPPGSCDDEDFFCAHPFLVNDSIFAAYLEDKDAGSHPHGEGTLTENPIRCWVFPCQFITDIHEQPQTKVSPPQRLSTFVQGPLTLPEGTSARVFDITGRQIHTLNPAPGIYFIEVDGEIKNKVIKVK